MSGRRRRFTHSRNEGIAEIVTRLLTTILRVSLYGMVSRAPWPTMTGKLHCSRRVCWNIAHGGDVVQGVSFADVILSCGGGCLFVERGKVLNDIYLHFHGWYAKHQQLTMAQIAYIAGRACFNDSFAGDVCIVGMTQRLLVMRQTVV